MNKKTMGIILIAVIAVLVGLVFWKKTSSTTTQETDIPAAVSQETEETEPEQAKDDVKNESDVKEPAGESSEQEALDKEASEQDTPDDNDSNEASNKDISGQKDEGTSVSVTDGGGVEITVPEEMGQGGF